MEDTSPGSPPSTAEASSDQIDRSAPPEPRTPAQRARAEFEAIENDPAGRLEFARECYLSSPNGQLHGYGEAELDFMTWEVRRGVLNPLEADRPGSPWWRAVNGRLLTDAKEAFILTQNGATEGSNTGVDAWLRFIGEPSPDSWYSAHNHSLCCAYLEHYDLARQESRHEQKMMNIALYRVLFTHAVVNRRRFTLGVVTGAMSGLFSPKSKIVALVVSDKDLYPDSYPLDEHDRDLLDHPFRHLGGVIAALIDRVVINPLIPRLYAYMSHHLHIPDLRDLHHGRRPCYPWARHRRHRPKHVVTTFGRPAFAKLVVDQSARWRRTNTFRGVMHRLELDGLWPIRLPWVMSQRWEHLLYLHYRVSADDLRRLVPAGLEIDEFDGSAWVTAIPLKMNRVHLRDVIPIPGTAHFPELNLRTYVTHEGVPGVYFLSIDAGSRLASLVARMSFRLPYFAAEMRFSALADGFRLTSCRVGAQPVRFDATYRPSGPASVAVAGSRDEFLAERYSMYSVGWFGRLIRGDISHAAWELQDAEVDIVDNEVLEAVGLRASDPKPIVKYSVGTEAKCWPMSRAGTPQRIWPRR